MILILSNEEDVTTDFVVRELAPDEFVRLNAERLPQVGSVSFAASDGCFHGDLRVGDAKVAFEEIAAVYCRRVGAPEASPEITDEGARAYASAEFAALVASLSRTIDALWVNHPLDVRRAESKPYQLAVAQRLGFHVPQTLITNDPDRAVEFARSQACRVAMKSLGSPRATCGGAERILFTRLLEPDEIELVTDVRLAPVILQEFVEKRVDLRVTVVGREAFAVEIDSQGTPQGKVDWRAAAMNDLPHRRHKLPVAVRDQCIGLCRALCLNFGAIDLALDAAGRYVFFEVNPNGQWAWVELLAGEPIARALANVLRGAA